ncbi:MAG TPA: T9SS type A sorting domain-containing protein [Ignavibacteria bacterium]|nr:T9SS type A sorting domain-containing protein [Ignavibacteria bacterium]
MKKLFTFLTFMFLLANSFYAGDRMVFIERFTSWTCGPCASNNPTMEAFINGIDADKIVGIAYHMNWPAPGNDGYYLYNPADNTARRSFYSVNSIPQARMDGIISLLSPYTNTGLTDNFNSRTNILSPITVILTDSTFGDSIRVRARIYCEVYLPNPNVLVHFSIQERHNHFSSPPGTNGETDFYDVMRRMNNGGTGHAAALYPGQTTIIEKTFYKDPIWNQPEVMPIVFVQRGQEILNAAKKTANFTLIPNSPFRSVIQGQSQSASYDLQIPVTSAGYNSAVTLTAEVDPPNAGITVSFPGGNVISSFPANFSVQVNSSASVPVNDYRIIITGTNSNGKTHKTSVSYLVGRNFVTVNTNRPLLQFKVDGTTYTSSAFFNWDVNSSHTLTAISPQTSGSTRYVFTSWSNGGDTNQTINVSANISSYTASYKTQFKLITSVTPGGLPVTVTGGNLFYDSASTVSFTATPSQLTHNGKEYYFQRWNGNGNGSYSGTQLNPTITNMNNVIVETAVFDTIAPIGIHNLNTGVPVVYELHQNFPNPFNPVTKIKFDLPQQSNVNIRVYDIIGNEVARVYNGELTAGFYEVDWNASDFASGVYFYRIDAGDFSSVKRMVLVK